jgi:chorismate synthase
MKPIPTTMTPQPSVDLSQGVEAPMVYERSDVCPVPRAVVVVEAMTAFVLAAALIEKLGGDAMDEMQTRFADLRQPRLQDLNITKKDRIWWT